MRNNRKKRGWKERQYIPTGRSARHIPGTRTWAKALNEAMQSTRNLRTQTALGRKAGVSQSEIGRILRDESSPKIETFRCIAIGLGMKLSEFISIAERLEDEAKKRNL